jgi:hypothetical protein
MRITWISSACSALLATSATASAEPVEIEAGAAHVTFGTAERDTGLAAAVSLGAGIKIDRALEATLRGHVTIGDGVIAALGLHVRHHVGSRVFLGYGPAIASVTAGGDRELRAHGIGLALDLRAGVRLGDVTLAVEALPIWVFANDSPAATAHLGYALELGIALGYQR